MLNAFSLFYTQWQPCTKGNYIYKIKHDFEIQFLYTLWSKTLKIAVMEIDHLAEKAKQ